MFTENHDCNVLSTQPLLYHGEQLFAIRIFQYSDLKTPLHTSRETNILRIKLCLEDEIVNYEELYADLQPVEKDLKDAVAQVTKHYKAIVKNTDNGNLTDMKKSITLLQEAIRQLESRAIAVDECVEAFDIRDYFVKGDFAEQMLSACEDRNIDVQGSKGVYEMFPYKVRVYGDEEHYGEVYINRKKLPTCRPSFVADTIAAGKEKLYREKFNEVSFMGELADAYDTTLLKEGARPGANLMLTKIYKTMAPMARARKEYDMQAFSFDLARLYEKGRDAWVTRSGRHFDFGTSRDGKSGIRVLSSSGAESYITTLKAFNQE